MSTLQPPSLAWGALGTAARPRGTTRPGRVAALAARACAAAVLASLVALATTAGPARADNTGGNTGDKTGDKSAAASPKMVSLAQALKRTALVFPFDAPKEVPNPYDVSQLLTDVAASRLEASGQYTVIEFNKSLPPVARAHMDQVLTDQDVSPPFADDTAKALKITKSVGYDVAVIGAIDEYTYNQADNSVKLVLRGQMLDAKTGKPIGAPVVLTYDGPAGGTAKEPQKALDAAREGGSQLMQKLVPLSTAPILPTPAQPSTGKNRNQPANQNGTKRRGNSGLLFGLLAIGLGLGIGLASSSGGHHGGGGGGGDNPPAPP